MPLAEKPLRKDAERNRQLILDAARELFAERGLGATLNEIAHHAGVGVGTVYRRFPDKERLIEGLFEQRMLEIVAIAEQSLEEPDPWLGVTGFLRRSLELQAQDRAIKELILGTTSPLKKVARIRERMYPLVTALVRRAQEAGQMRSDIDAQDMPIMQLMLGTVIDVSRDIEPELWRRFLEIVLQGLRAEPIPPTKLETRALPFDRLPDLMAAWQPPRR